MKMIKIAGAVLALSLSTAAYAAADCCKGMDCCKAECCKDGKSCCDKKDKRHAHPGE